MLCRLLAFLYAKSDGYYLRGVEDNDPEFAI